MRMAAEMCEVMTLMRRLCRRIQNWNGGGGSTIRDECPRHAIEQAIQAHTPPPCILTELIDTRACVAGC